MQSLNTRIEYYLLFRALRSTREVDSMQQESIEIPFQAKFYEKALKIIARHYHSIGQENEGDPDLPPSSQVVPMSEKHWDKFYQSNADKFFKNRHYLLKVFPELLDAVQKQQPFEILEVGCGVANAVAPLLEEFEHIFATLVDFSATAVQIVRRMKYGNRLKAYKLDITRDNLVSKLNKSFDFATLIFVLSALEPSKMKRAVLNIADTLKLGGVILFRDYAMYDMAQLRFKRNQIVSSNFYLRQDGTSSFFFTLAGVEWLFAKECGLQCVYLHTVNRNITNAKAKLEMPRRFVNACYQRI